MTSLRANSQLGIPPEAFSAWLALCDSLDRLKAQGQQPVCASRPDQWSPDATPAARQDAAEACGYCPVLHACGAYATAAKERHGVWGGLDRGAHPNKVTKENAA